MSEAIEQVKKLCPMCRSEADIDARFCKHCAFDLSASTTDRTNSAEKRRSAATSKFLIAGIIIVVVAAAIILSAVLFGNRRSRTISTNTNAAAPTPLSVMGAKGLEIEQKILRNQALSVADLDGLTPVELRLLRNAHFARYGRIYMQRELNDYFRSRPWYEPSDAYRDRFLTKTDKENVELILSLEKPETAASSSPPVTGYASPQSTPPPSYSPDSRTLTADNAQDALNRFASANGSGQIRIKGGVREIPAQNSAVAELDVDGFSDQRGRNYRGKRAVAGFSRYTDGRWSLTEVVIMLDNYFDKTTWKPTIDVR